MKLYINILRLHTLFPTAGGFKKEFLGLQTLLMGRELKLLFKLNFADLVNVVFSQNT